MKTNSNSLCLLLSLCALVVSVTPLTRRPFGEECSRIQKCDRTAWLSCRDGKCDCTKPEQMVYDEGKKKCVTISGERCKYGVDENEENSLVEITECVPNTACSSGGVCLCDSKFQKIYNGTCGLSMSFGENCTEEDQCSKYVELKCVDSKCQCHEGIYSEENGLCVGLSQSDCGQQNECVEGAVCVQGKCLCDSQHYPSVQKTCLRKKSVFQNCSKDVECSQTDTLNLRCISGTCSCPAELVFSMVQKFAYSIKIGFTRPFVYMCAPRLGEKCPHGYCMENAFCDAELLMTDTSTIAMDSCKCIDKKFSPNKDSQYCGKIYDEDCTVNGDCIDDLVCSDKCNCPSPSHQSFDSSSRKCVTEVGAHCTKASTCVEDAECVFLSPTSRSGHCRCKRNFVVNGNRLCDRSYGTDCSESYPKCDTTAGYMCIDNQCSCPDTMYKYDSKFRKCLGLVGARCNKSDEIISCGTINLEYVVNVDICKMTPQSKLACIANAYCNEEHSLLKAECKCIDGYEETDDHTCVVISSSSINPVVCDSSEFLCDDFRRCVPMESRCDGKTDCFDRSDEEGCTAEVIFENNYFNSTCDLHMCKNGQCIMNEWVCDGIVHCDDNSDEIDCRANETEEEITDPGNVAVCSADSHWTCRNGECIDKTNFCDGNIECTDSSDEPDGCGKWEQCNDDDEYDEYVDTNRYRDHFKCFSDGCVQRHLLCDGTENCEDGSDEAVCAIY